MEKIKKHKQSISKHYERIAESLDKFLPLRIWERFEWIIDDVKVKYGIGIDEDHPEDNSYPICLEVIPSYKLTPEEWYALHYQIVNFLYEVLPEEIANLVGVCLWIE